jgi:uncharacterized cupredoxin-like copper-binding protein
MKTLFALLVASAVSLALVQAEDKTLGEKSSEVWDKTKKTTKKAGRAVATKTKEVAAAVEDAVTKPDDDARKVTVKLNEHRIQMPQSLAAGKTAFMVTNVGKQKHNFEIQGEGLEKSFWLSVAPKNSKVMQVNLKPGTYKVYCPLEDHEGKGMKMQVTVQ